MVGDFDRTSGSNSASWGVVNRFRPRTEPNAPGVVSAIEAEVLLHAAPAYEKPVDEAFCPFQKGNLCTAREPRPLACRIYYCDPNYQETGNRITEIGLHRLKTLAREHGLEWQYAPLHHFLNAAAESHRQPPTVLDRST